ncbi:MAG: hypothetical protein J0M08_01355 [Bacteroidetes bacterium]|nr:hypothetical protein [Bacteroidota bacterium]
MKNVILSILALVIILSSCKTNTFVARKYTKGNYAEKATKLDKQTKKIAVISGTSETKNNTTQKVPIAEQSTSFNGAKTANEKPNFFKNSNALVEANRKATVNSKKVFSIKNNTITPAVAEAIDTEAQLKKVERHRKANFFTALGVAILRVLNFLFFVTQVYAAFEPAGVWFAGLGAYLVGLIGLSIIGLCVFIVNLFALKEAKRASKQPNLNEEQKLRANKAVWYAIISLLLSSVFLLISISIPLFVLIA